MTVEVDVRGGFLYKLEHKKVGQANTYKKQLKFGTRKRDDVNTNNSNKQVRYCMQVLKIVESKLC